MEYVNAIDFERGFHVIRDPRDIVVSSYFSHLLSHPTEVWKELTAHREHLKKLSQEEGIRYEIEVCRKEQFIDLQTWDYNQDNVLELKFEDFIVDLEMNWSKILDFLGIEFSNGDSKIKSESIAVFNRLFGRLDHHMPNFSFDNFLIKQRLHPSTFKEILVERDFVSRAGRGQGTEDINHHYRKGVSGDWKNYFTEPLKDSFKKNWGDLLIQLNYEKDLNW